MKQFLLPIICMLSFFQFAQTEHNFQLGVFTTSEIPFHSEMPKMSTNIGLGMQFAYKPIARVPVFLEFKGNLGMYNSQKRDVTYIFDNGATTDTYVNFTSQMHKIQLGTKIYYTSFYNPVRAYITPQIGHNFMRTRVRIADPMDEDDCRPLENTIKQRSGGWTYGGEIGIELDMKKIFTGNDRPNQRMYLSASYMGSFKKMDYINVKYMEEHEHDVVDTHDHSQMDEDGRPLNAEFINLTSGTTHEHKVAEIYNTHLRFISINLGYVWYF